MNWFIWFFGNPAVELVSADSTTMSDLDETVCYLDSGDDNDDDSDGPLFVEDNSSEEEEDSLNFPNWLGSIKNVNI